MTDDFKDLDKVQPTPVFPKIGLPDDCRATPILNTPEELNIKIKALANASARSNPGTEPSDFKQMMEDASNKNVGLTSSKPNSGLAYSLGPNLRTHLSTFKEFPSSQATKLHEDWHLMMNRIEGKFGRAGRKNFALNLYNAIPSQFRTAVDAFHVFKSNKKDSPEEVIAGMHNYLNDKEIRERFYNKNKFNLQQKLNFDTRMKRAYKALRAAAAVATADWAKSEEITEEALDKSLKHVLLALAAASSLTTPSFAASKEKPHKVIVSKPVKKKWTPNGLHNELYSIAHIESSFGKNMNHAKSPKGEFDTAVGALGLKPQTAHEEYLKQSHLQKLFPGFKDPNKFLIEFKKEPAFYNAIANSHWQRIKKSTGGSAEKAAYAWRWGVGAAHSADENKVNSDPYVNKFKSLLDKQNSEKVTKSEEESIYDMLFKQEMFQNIKNWHSRDGITIPASFNPDRKDYDQKFFELLDEKYGSGNKAQLRPAVVSLGCLFPTNGVINKDRYSLYSRMLRGGDKVPPIIIQKNGSGYDIVDGNHRFNAAKDNNISYLDAYEILSKK